MAFAITIIFIVLSTVIAAFVRRRSRDKCLKDFSDDLVTLVKTDGKIVWGKLNVENTGLEFVYPDIHKDEDGHNETSYVLYKYEYGNIQTLIRYHDQLSKLAKKQRQEELKKTYHPTFSRRLKRRIQNAFKTVRDSVMEVLNMLISQAKKAAPVGGVLASQDKYVSKMKQELIGSVGTSFEPLLEKYIGHKVVLELLKGDAISEYCGVLKEYTAEFIEIMDVDYLPSQVPVTAGKAEDDPHSCLRQEDVGARKADITVPRKCGVIRHLGE